MYQTATAKKEHACLRSVSSIKNTPSCETEIENHDGLLLTDDSFRAVLLELVCLFMMMKGSPFSGVCISYSYIIIQGPSCDPILRQMLNSGKVSFMGVKCRMIIGTVRNIGEP